MENEKEDFDLDKILAPETDVSDKPEDAKPKAVDSIDGTTTPAEKDVKAELYSAEELKSLSTDELDVNRLPPELQEKYRAMQAPITRRQQELARQQKEWEQRTAQAGQPRTPDEAFQKDPVGFMRSLDNVILNLEGHEAELRYSDPEKAAEIAKQVFRAKTARNNYNNAVQDMMGRMTYEQQVSAENIAELTDSIPNYGKRSEELIHFAASKGIPERDLLELTNPNRVGKVASQFAIKIFNEYFELVNANKKANAKLKKEAPAALVRGGGTKDEEGEEDSDHWSSVKNVDKYLKTLGV